MQNCFKTVNGYTDIRNCIILYNAFKTPIPQAIKLNGWGRDVKLILSLCTYSSLFILERNKRICYPSKTYVHTHIHIYHIAAFFIERQFILKTPLRWRENI